LAGGTSLAKRLPDKEKPMSTDSEPSNHSVSRSARQLLQVFAVVATVAGASSSARAGDAYGGTVEAAYHCEPEVDAWSAASDGWKWLDDALKSGKVFTPACKAEFDQRMQLCLKDPAMKWKLDDPDYTKGIPGRACHQEVFGGIWEQVVNDRNHKKEAEEQAKAKAEDDAKRAAEIAAREAPKATRHDAKLEKAVADAYHRDYPDGKVLKVILGDWSTDYEKDAFDRVTGRDLDATVVNKEPDGKCYLHGELWLQYGNGRSFSGPLSARGAGSASDAEILCSKVEGAASAPTKAAKGAPRKK
jgi:hypothetical protein